MEEEYIVKNRKDLGKISERAKVLKVRLPLRIEDAVDIMKRCRTLREIRINLKSMRESDASALDYLNKWVFVESE